MSNELLITPQVVVRRGTTTTTLGAAYQEDLTGAVAIPKQQDVTTSMATLDVSGVTTLKSIVIKNPDPDNYLSIGVDVSSTFYESSRIGPGEEWAIPLAPGVTQNSVRHR